MWDEWETNLIVHQRVKTISAERLQGVHAPGKDMTIADDIMLKTKLSDCKLWLNLLVSAVVLAQAPLPCRPGQLSYNPCHPSSLLLLLEEDNAVRSWWQNNLHITGDSSIQDVMTKRRAKTIWPKIRLQKIDSNVALKMVRRKNWPGAHEGFWAGAVKEPPTTGQVWTSFCPNILPDANRNLCKTPDFGMAAGYKNRLLWSAPHTHKNQ